MNPILPHLPDDEVIAWLKEEGLVPMRPLRERWPELFAGQPSIEPEGVAQPVIDIWAEADVCGWPPDDKPLVDAEKHRAWCTPVARRMADPPKRPPAVRLFDPANAVPPPGRYQIVLLAYNLQRVRRRGAMGFAAFISIVDGEHAGCELRVEFLTEGDGRATSVVMRDLAVLGEWQKAHGIGTVDSELALMQRLAEAGLRTDTFAVLVHRRWRGGLDIGIEAIEVRQ